MPQATRRRRHIFLVTLVSGIAIVALFLAGYGVYINRLTRYDRDPLSDPAVGFQMLEPTKLPPGIKITDKRLGLNHSAPHKIRNTWAELNFRTEDWVYSIQESKAGDVDKEETITTLTNFDPSSVQPTCTQRKSPHGSTYRLCHWIDYGRISVYEINNIQQGVYILTRFPTLLQKPLTVEDTDAYIDSFKPVNSSGLPILVDTI